MNILWRNGSKVPSSGDIKILKDGTMFIRGRHIVVERGQRYHNNTGGRPNYIWFPFVKSSRYVEPSGLDMQREQFLSKGMSLFSAQSGTKLKKTKTIILDMSIESDRKKYMDFFNLDKVDSGIDKITLSIAA
ncbi:hypothetical protein LMH73_020160 [Vibrio splendidus]|nr:hypothetical protein [Vibrio splendidus]MCC4880481.1 hypothetical protein [Vibrio splendidus]